MQSAVDELQRLADEADPQDLVAVDRLHKGMQFMSGVDDGSIPRSVVYDCLEAAMDCSDGCLRSEAIEFAVKHLGEQVLKRLVEAQGWRFHRQDLDDSNVRIEVFTAENAEKRAAAVAAMIEQG